MTFRLRIPLIAVSVLVAAHVHAVASPFDDVSPGSIAVNLGYVTAMAKSVAAWVEDGLGPPRHAEPTARREGCGAGLRPGCAYIDWWWFGSRPDAHYEGEFRGGLTDGHGVYRWSDGSRYEGEFRAGQFDGRGVYFWSNGASYAGEWEYGRPNGAGSLSTAQGTFKGIWMDGCLFRDRGLIAVANDASSCRRLAKARRSHPEQYRAAAETRAARSQISALFGCITTAEQSSEDCLSGLRRE